MELGILGILGNKYLQSRDCGNWEFREFWEISISSFAPVGIVNSGNFGKYVSPESLLWELGIQGILGNSELYNARVAPLGMGNSGNFGK